MKERLYTMLKFDYSNYKQFIDSLDLKADPFNPDFEDLKDYINISENFDPISNPPDETQKEDYIMNTIVPIMKHYAKDSYAILTIKAYESNIVITLMIDELVISDDNFDFKYILSYSSSFFISAIDSGKLKVELFFHLAQS